MTTDEAHLGTNRDDLASEHNTTDEASSHNVTDEAPEHHTTDEASEHNVTTDEAIQTHLGTYLDSLASAHNLTIPAHVRDKILKNLLPHVSDREQYEEYRLDLIHKRGKGYVARLKQGDVAKLFGEYLEGKVGAVQGLGKVE